MIVMNIYKTFIYMFYALDAVYDEEPNDNLGNYLSGLNPFLFNDEGSANPAEYEEFKTAYMKFFNSTKQNTENIYEFCKSYLNKSAPKEAIEAFEKVKKQEWIESFESAEE